MIRHTPLLAAVLSTALVGTARAADIATTRMNGLDVIAIDGPIAAGDEDQFDRVSQNVGQMFNQPAIVLFNSPGGAIFPALSIGAAIRAKGYATGVVSGAQCASACALMWLAGTKRLLGNSAKVGFHAAYVIADDNAQESGQANALVGAYLSKLGLSYRAIAYVTAAGPGQMSWLHPDDAREAGIQLEVMPDPQPAAPETAAAAPAAPPAAREINVSEQRAKAIVTAYYDLWSRTGTDVEGLAQYYGDTAAFYGSTEPRDKIMDEKRKFSVRWPIRHYTIRPGTVFAQCTDTCSVAGVVEWDVSSIERGAHSVGSASFVLKIALTSGPAGGIILSENGAVLAAHNDNLPTAQASLNPAPAAPVASGGYAAGRQARIDYEAWFNSLPAGEYRSGAEFWAENRSLKVPPSCEQPGKVPQWMMGCLAGRERLTPSDARRRADNEYRAGWNSL